MADDDIIFSNKDISITPTLAKFGGASYPVNTIASVYVAKPQTLQAWIFGAIATLIGLVAMSSWLDGGAPFLLAAIPMALGLFLLWSAYSAKHSLMLQTAAGSQQAYSSKNRPYLHEVKAAIEKAVAARG